MPIETMMYVFVGLFFLVFVVVAIGIVKKSRGQNTGSRSRDSSSDFDSDFSGGD